MGTLGTRIDSEFTCAVCRQAVTERYTSIFQVIPDSQTVVCSKIAALCSPYQLELQSDVLCRQCYLVLCSIEHTELSVWLAKHEFFLRLYTPTFSNRRIQSTNENVAEAHPKQVVDSRKTCNANKDGVVKDASHISEVRVQTAEASFDIAGHQETKGVGIVSDCVSSSPACAQTPDVVMSHQNIRHKTEDSKYSAKKTAENTISSMSRCRYEEAWNEFSNYWGCSSKPGACAYLEYFNHLRTDKLLKSSSLWSVFSRLNSIHQSKYGEKLQKYPQITKLLKTYESDYVRRVTSMFEQEHIDGILNMPDLDSPYWLCRKAIVVVVISGGLRCPEVREIKMSDVIHVGDTYTIRIQKDKGGKDNVYTEFSIPASVSIHLSKYLAAVRAYLGDKLERDSPLILGTPIYNHTKKSRFAPQPMGRNYLSKIGQDIATKLKLPRPENYTGSCFKKAAIANKADPFGSSQLVSDFYSYQGDAAVRYVDPSDVRYIDDGGWNPDATSMMSNWQSSGPCNQSFPSSSHSWPPVATSMMDNADNHGTVPIRYKDTVNKMDSDMIDIDTSLVKQETMESDMETSDVGASSVSTNENHLLYSREHFILGD